MSVIRYLNDLDDQISEFFVVNFMNDFANVGVQGNCFRIFCLAKELKCQSLLLYIFWFFVGQFNFNLFIFFYFIGTPGIFYSIFIIERLRNFDWFEPVFIWNDKSRILYPGIFW